MLRPSPPPPMPSDSARGLRFAIVAARFNARYVDAMLAAARDTLKRAGASPASLRVVRVPGSFEIPVAMARMAAQKKYDALIALGLILRGQTAHADLIARAVTDRLSEIAVHNGVPVIHEVLLVANESQAAVRCLGVKHNRGAEAARAAIEMAQLMRQIRS